RRTKARQEKRQKSYVCSHGFESVGVDVTDRNGECIRSVIRLRRRIKLQKGSNHLLNLWFLCSAVTGNRALHFQWRVFVDRQIRFSSGKYRNAANMSQF